MTPLQTIRAARSQKAQAARQLGIAAGRAVPSYFCASFEGLEDRRLFAGPIATIDDMPGEGGGEDPPIEVEEDAHESNNSFTSATLLPLGDAGLSATIHGPLGANI